MIPEKNIRYLWLSHPLNDETPQYGGGKGFSLIEEKSIVKGDSCNTNKAQFSNHIGSHVDFPKHFFINGSSIESYGIEDWIFKNPFLLETKEIVEPGKLIEPRDIHIPQQGELNDQVDIILIRTGFENYRKDRTYWKDNPGLSPDFAEIIRNNFPMIKAVGMDMISISNLNHREKGRKAHRAFLSKGIRIFEDLCLSGITSNNSLMCLIALPLRISDANGTPCTIIGWE